MNATKTLKALCRNVSIQSEGGAHLEWDKQDQWQQQANGWWVTLRYQGRQYSFDFWQGAAITGEPTAEGCLECLLSDASGADNSFEDFCSEFGYDSDSRKAERIYHQCEKVAENVKRLLGDDYETFLHSDR